MLQLKPRFIRAALAVVLAACASENIANAPPSPLASASVTAQTSPPPFNLDVVLTDAGGGSARGTLRFRQTPDLPQTVKLDVHVYGLTPQTHYSFQRAVDAADGVCTSTAWLTIGKGTVPQDIITGPLGNGEAKLFRSVASAPGSPFDIRFRVIETSSGAVALVSGCYQYTVR